jgi:Tol biopolymer transport system component
MIAGRRAFGGDEVSDTLAAVLRAEPDWNELPADLAPAIRVLLRRCLMKERNQRIADISTALFVIEEAVTLVACTERLGAVLAQRQIDAAFAAGQQRGEATLSTLRRAMRRRLGRGIVAAVLVTGAIVGAVTWYARRPAAPRVSRLLIAPPPAAALTINGIDRDVAITPDGSRLVYVGNRGTQLFVRALDALEPVTVFTGQPHGLFVSPDGQWIGFADGNALKKVPVSGGPPITLAMIGSRGGAIWGPDDTIIVAPSNVAGLQRVSTAGGPATMLTRPDRARGEADHFWPEMLPGGRAVLFTITAVTGGLDAAQVAVLDLQTGTRKVLLRGGSHAHYVASGHLVYAAAGTLRAVPFDLAHLEVRGTPVPVVPAVVTTSLGAVDAVVSDDGTLAYVSGNLTGTPRTLVWVDRQGRETPIPMPPRAYLLPALSPDGTRVAVFANDQDLDVWIWDLARAALTPFTFAPGIDAVPVWTPDGRRLIFSSERAGVPNVFWQAADGTGPVERLAESPNIQYPSAVSPDGRRLIFAERDPKTLNDEVMAIELDGTRRQTPLVQSPFSQRNGIVSPDGRWLAYEANDSGQFEIYVRPFPEVNNGHWQASTTGGTRPLWTRSGRELVYVSPTGALMGVRVAHGPSWAATTPTLLVKEGYVTNPIWYGRTYDISPDGQRFLMVKDASADETAPPRSLIVVQNWVDELKQRVPTR